MLKDAVVACREIDRVIEGKQLMYELSMQNEGLILKPKLKRVLDEDQELTQDTLSCD